MFQFFGYNSNTFFNFLFRCAHDAKTQYWNPKEKLPRIPLQQIQLNSDILQGVNFVQILLTESFGDSICFSFAWHGGHTFRTWYKSQVHLEIVQRYLDPPFACANEVVELKHAVSLMLKNWIFEAVHLKRLTVFCVNPDRIIYERKGESKRQFSWKYIVEGQEHSPISD